ncbi:hypothetical protein L0666_10655 [Octadecabacter sp. CECT 8868]|uniref:hypothetical protein n=1 Tax=Octadecabacter algicola TaxID=2909342 RepID=UPI001F3B8DCF|nr:hypothetical protein [Octadecabacter algicola]MCF2905450.1 hypothetical protein [Octadecabacter algicola]
MAIIVRILSVLGLTVLVSCTTVPQTEPCQSPEACLMSGLMVQGMAPSIGEDFGGGVTLSNVQAAGALVVFDLKLPIGGAGLETVQKRILHDVASQGFVNGFCGQASGEADVFQFGNAYQIRTVGSDGIVIGASTLRSCGG